jgi:hypothetical protein
VPGMPYYDRTRQEEIFCTKADARAAGYPAGHREIASQTF